ncbi:MAG: (2Fe-2S)-binding protein [Lachnospiraceae bacterium]|nr:(2Fe-2S)-binding protein [Lachnospiraceae bacterium]
MDENEVICNCLGTTVGDIKKAMEDGAQNIADIQEMTQAGTACGACLDSIEALMEQLKK